MTIIKREFLIKELQESYPTARPAFIEIMVECIALHAGKNNDYNGGIESPFKNTSEEVFHDVKRKFSRLHTHFILKTSYMIGEGVIETAKDLLVYSGLLIEQLQEEQDHGKES
jgi:hypothetical protein